MIQIMARRSDKLRKEYGEKQAKSVREPQSHCPSVCNQTRMGERWEWWEMFENAEILTVVLPGTTEEELKHRGFSLIEKRKQLSVCVYVCGYMCAPVWRQLCMWKMEKCTVTFVTFNIFCVFCLCLLFVFFNLIIIGMHAMLYIYNLSLM